MLLNRVKKFQEWINLGYDLALVEYQDLKGEEFEAFKETMYNNALTHIGTLIRGIPKHTARGGIVGGLIGLLLPEQPDITYSTSIITSALLGGSLDFVQFGLRNFYSYTRNNMRYIRQSKHES